MFYGLFSKLYLLYYSTHPVFVMEWWNKEKSRPNDKMLLAWMQTDFLHVDGP